MLTGACLLPLQAIGRVRYEFIQKMLLPCGVPPEREEE